METKFPSKSKWLPKIKYKKFRYPKESCGNCKHSYCHNPGANITGLSCRIIEKELSKIERSLPAKDEKGNSLHYTGVVFRDDICKMYVRYK